MIKYIQKEKQLTHTDINTEQMYHCLPLFFLKIFNDSGLALDIVNEDVILSEAKDVPAPAP